MSREPGHAPMDDFTLAVECVRVYTEAFQGFIDDINSSGIDMRIFSKATVAKMKEAGEKRKELSRRIEIANAELARSEGEHH
jgi:hypothetical protein